MIFVKLPRTTLCLCLLLAYADLVGQEVMLAQSLNSDHLEWFEGSITKNDGTILKGLVKYNDKNGALFLEMGDKSVSLTPRSVTSFEYNDEAQKTHRQFLALEYEDAQTQAKRPVFFELLREFKTFAILSKADPIEIDHPQNKNVFNNNTNNMGTGTTGNIYARSLKVQQTETIYVLNQTGDIQPYCKVINEEIDGGFKDRSKTKNKLVDGDVLEKQIGASMWKTLQEYAKQEHLSFKKKNDVLLILDHYATLIEQ